VENGKLSLWASRILGPARGDSKKNAADDTLNSKKNNKDTKRVLLPYAKRRVNSPITGERYKKKGGGSKKRRQKTKTCKKNEKKFLPKKGEWGQGGKQIWPLHTGPTRQDHTRKNNIRGASKRVGGEWKTTTKTKYCGRKNKTLNQWGAKNVWRGNCLARLGQQGANPRHFKTKTFLGGDRGEQHSNNVTKEKGGGDIIQRQWHAGGTKQKKKKSLGGISQKNGPHSAFGEGEGGKSPTRARPRTTPGKTIRKSELQS